MNIQLRKISGEIAVRNNGDGYTARHAGKSSTCTSSKQGALDAVMKKIYGKKTFYYRTVAFKFPPGGAYIEIYQALSEEIA